MSASTDTASAPGLSRLPWPAIAPLAAWLVFLLTFWLEGPVATTLVAVALVCVVDRLRQRFAAPRAAVGAGGIVALMGGRHRGPVGWGGIVALMGGEASWP